MWLGSILDFCFLEPVVFLVSVVNFMWLISGISKGVGVNLLLVAILFGRLYIFITLFRELVSFIVCCV